MIYRLKVFKKVADCLSFTKAAKILFITQPAITKHINELEKHFEKALFNRHGNKISLTTEGQLLLQHTNKILNSYNQLEDDFLALNSKLPNKITIGASTTISQYILPKILSKFKTVYSNTNITLLNNNSENIESSIINKQVDIGFTEGKTSNPLLRYETFVLDEIVLATSVTNTTIKKPEITLEELKNLPLIVREKGSGTQNIVKDSLYNNNIDMKQLSIEMTLGSTESIKTYLMHSNSYSFLSIHSISNELKNNRLKVIDITSFDIKRVFHVVNLHGEYSNTVEKLKHFFTTHYNLME
ncbi:LysR family transcriptional regulator [Aquimarina sediminis]|uniref:LysR family transcriptional regulator n=1 Tax=Aquimarina sediminis TaxID=2070536 RepID=UPI000CA04653|nr:LysR family transcriptional regulator [Aquimarina sediminis]